MIVISTLSVRCLSEVRLSQRVMPVVTWSVPGGMSVKPQGMSVEPQGMSVEPGALSVDQRPAVGAGSGLIRSD